jgi:hypothetical protein
MTGQQYSLRTADVAQAGLRGTGGTGEGLDATTVVLGTLSAPPGRCRLLGTDQLGSMFRDERPERQHGGINRAEVIRQAATALILRDIFGGDYFGLSIL